MVQPDSVSVYVGGSSEPNLVIHHLNNGRAAGGKIGMWGSSSGYMRNLVVEEIPTVPVTQKEAELTEQGKETIVTEWMVSKSHEQAWVRAQVEENGTLNLNRLFSAEKGAVVQAKCSFYLSEAKETWLSFGFSDRLRLWVNDHQVYEGEWKWHSPGKATDGRIRYDHVVVPVQWKSGLNTIHAEVVSEEDVWLGTLC